MKPTDKAVPGTVSESPGRNVSEPSGGLDKNELRRPSPLETRLREELAKLQVEVNEEKSRRVDLTQGESFDFLGCEFRRIRSRRGRWMPLRTPRG